MSKIRKQALEKFAKDVEQGIPLAEEYIGKTKDPLTNALKARNLSEETLAQKVLDNTGIPIPDNKSPLSKKEDFLNQILKERYPEFDPNLSIKDLDKDIGEYNYNTKNITLNKKLAKDRDIIQLTSDALHEGGHKYDDIKKIVPDISQDDFMKEMRKLKSSGFDLKNADPAQVYELIAGKHHANIPNLRQGTFGLGALKSFLKSGTFKGVGALLGKGLAAGAGGLASLAAEASDAEEEGSLNQENSLLREIKQKDFEKKIMEAIPEENRSKVQEEFDAQKLGLRRNALIDLLKR